MILMIDNYDSFTYNLVQYLGELGARVETVRNDEVTVREVADLKPEGIVISPGPCTPNGAKVVRAERIMHGKTSMIYHRSQGVFAGLPQPFQATRYHSLVLEKGSIPESLAVMAWTEYEGGHEIMGVRHVKYDIQGVQFHPESILTTRGHDLLRNFLRSVSMRY